MKQQCFICEMESDNKKDFFELSGKISPRTICKTCASEVGINNFMSAGFHSNLSVLKKYVKIHPEAQPKLDQLVADLHGFDSELRSGLKQGLDNAKKSLDNATKYSGCTKKKQMKCICLSCDNTYYYGDYEVIKNVTNVLHGSLYSLNNFKDLDQCPKCSSRAITKKEVYFWIDKKGNCIDVEE